MLYNRRFDRSCASQIIFGKISQLEMLFLPVSSLIHSTTMFLTFRNSSYCAVNLITNYVERFVNLSNRAVKEPSINQRSSLWSIHLQVGVHDKSALWQI